jgi:diaminopimelate decarboxylase
MLLLSDQLKQFLNEFILLNRMSMELKFLTSENIKKIDNNFQTPVFVYSEQELKKSANLFLNFPNAY